VSDQPQRTNNYTTEPTTEKYRQCLFDWLVAHAPLWNQINYRRRQAYFEDSQDVWEAEYSDLYNEYAPILGKATCQQVARKNADAWRSFFTQLEQYREGDPSVPEKPSPPGYWGNRDDGYDLHGLVRNDLYTFDWDENKSVLEFGVGEALEEKYDFEYQEQLTLEVRGNPQWTGDDSRLELIYDEVADTLRVKHPVRIQSDRLQEQREDAFTHTLDTENTTHSAAIDVGANNTLAIVTNTGETAVYHARPEFERFQLYSQQIAQLQSELPEGEYSSERIRRLYSERSEKRDHSRDAAVKHATDWLLEQNVDTVYVGDLSDVLEAHWSSIVNEKTHSFWSHGQLTDRVELTMGDVGINVEEVSERDSSSKCPECDSENVHRNGDKFGCRDCSLEAHSDVVGAWNMLQNEEVGSMARPAVLRAERRRNASQTATGSNSSKGAYWEWDEHDWILGSFEEQSYSTFAVGDNQTSISKPASSQLG
jgi:putative transposase